jgi:hypothetical protein
MFRPFTLADVYAYAADRGYSREDVEVRPYEYLDGTVTYTVEFGIEYTEMWSWEFDDLDGVATDYEHLVWE